MSTVILSPQLVEQKKTEAVEKQTLIKRVLTRDLKLVDDQHVKINDYMVKITPVAYKSLIQSLGLPTSFMGREVKV